MGTKLTHKIRFDPVKQRVVLPPSPPPVPNPVLCPINTTTTSGDTAIPGNWIATGDGITSGTSAIKLSDIRFYGSTVTTSGTSV